VNLNDNPIFLTQKRLVHRGGVLAAILIAGLIGLSLLSGLIAYLADTTNFSFQSPQEAGTMFYGWTIGIEILVLVIGGHSRIATALANERKAGLWDSNRLTPLKPRELVMGYWFGSPLREAYMAAILAVIGLAIVLVSRMSITIWLGTQILIISTALFFGLLGVLVGMAFQRPQGILILLGMFFLFPMSFMAPSRMLTNFLLPIYGITHFFIEPSNYGRDWYRLPALFGISIYPVILSLLLQGALGTLIWRAVVRKTAHPFQPLLLRWEAIVLFTILVAAQYGLIWDIWRGTFPDFNVVPPGSRYGYETDSLMPLAYGSTLFIGVIMLSFSSPLPEQVRLESLRLGDQKMSFIFARSSLPLALALAGVAAVAVLTECIGNFGENWDTYFIVVGNLLNLFLIFSLLLEFCRAQFRRRALGFVALWLFILCVLPFILAGVFGTKAAGRLSLLSPGFLALSDSRGEDKGYLLGIVAAHFGITFLLFLVWKRQWKQVLARAV